MIPRAACAAALLAALLPAARADDAAARQRSIERGAAALVRLQETNGRWSSALHAPLRGPGLTALCADTLLALPQRGKAADAAATRALARLIRELGAETRFGGDCRYPTYALALLLRALTRPASASVPGRAALRRRIRARLLDWQLTEARGWREGAGAHGAWDRDAALHHPDARYANVSVTALALQALAADGLPKQHAAMQRARAFLRRTLTEPGGARFTVDPRLSKAGPAPYGSATADALLGLLASGSPPTDPACANAARWLTTHLDPTRVPGFPADNKPARDWPSALRFYYLARTAEALAASQTRGDWSTRLTRRLVADQREDGSWKGASPLMMEDDPRLATALALRALTASAP